jgi:adenylate cyclase
MTDTQISAQAIETDLTDSQLIRNGNTNLIEIIAVFVIGFLLIALVPRFNITSTVLAYLTLLTGIISSSLVAYNGYNYMLDASFPVLFITIIWGHLVFNSFAKQYRLRQQIKKQFEHYLDPRMVKKLQKDPGLLKLGGETKTMTFMFSDIRGFTPISEKYKGNPQGLTRLINRFLTRMTNIIIKNGGTVDKYMGDCIMAFWNAPLDTPRHETLAIKTALQMQKELKKLNRELKKEKLPQINIGIGINTGEALVGNMGSDQRFDYSVIGDDVNLASRLESSSKELQTTLVIGEKTRIKCKKIKFTSLGSIKVKGKTEDIKVYTVK